MARQPSMKKVQAVYDAVRPAWLRRKGVVAVEIGLKTTRDAAGRERSGVEGMTKARFQARAVDDLVVAIVVYVEEKLAPADLRANQAFPKEVEGVPVDVQVMPTTRLVAGMSVNPVLGGVEIARQNNPADFGTLTFCVVKVNDPAETAQYLTCAHVAFTGLTGNPAIVQPAVASPAAVIGTSDVNGMVAKIAKVDAATIAPTPPRSGVRFRLLDASQVVTINGVGAAAVRDVVRFAGATTPNGIDGVVSNASATRAFSYPNFGVKTWVGLIEVDAGGAAAQGGDSGAPLYRVRPNGKVEVLGMVIGVGLSADNSRELTYAQPFGGVVGSFKNLGVKL